MSQFPTPPTPASPPTSYANQVSLVFSPWDLTMDFLHVAPVQSTVEVDGKPTVQTTGAVAQAAHRIVMSPQHAKALARILQDNIDRYEAQFGAIPTPPSGVTGGTTGEVK